VIIIGVDYKRSTDTSRFCVCKTPPVVDLPSWYNYLRNLFCMIVQSSNQIDSSKITDGGNNSIIDLTGIGTGSSGNGTDYNILFIKY
jgi:hypothetical protein